MCTCMNIPLLTETIKLGIPVVDGRTLYVNVVVDLKDLSATS